MRRELGVGYCGLVCALCGENEYCVGCQKRGCDHVDQCKNFMCCHEHLPGCYACEQFPCKESMLDNPRIYAFAKFCGIYGEEALLDYLARNEAQGIQYHQPGGHIGDYDGLSESEIFHLLIHGKEK